MLLHRARFGLTGGQEWVGTAEPELVCQRVDAGPGRSRAGPAGTPASPCSTPPCWCFRPRVGDCQAGESWPPPDPRSPPARHPGSWFVRFPWTQSDILVMVTRGNLAEGRTDGASPDQPASTLTSHQALTAMGSTPLNPTFGSHHNAKLWCAVIAPWRLGYGAEGFPDAAAYLGADTIPRDRRQAPLAGPALHFPVRSSVTQIRPAGRLPRPGAMVSSFRPQRRRSEGG